MTSTTTGLMSLLSDGIARSIDEITAETRLPRSVVFNTVNSMRGRGLVASQPIVYGLTSEGKCSLKHRIRHEEAKAAIAARKAKRAAAKTTAKPVVHRDEEARPYSTNDIVASAVAKHASNPLFALGALGGKGA